MLNWALTLVENFRNVSQAEKKATGIFKSEHRISKTCKKAKREIGKISKLDIENVANRVGDLLFVNNWRNIATIIK